MIAINVSGLRKSFKAQTVLDGVHFTVKAGEIFALLRADDGAAEVCGFDVAKQARHVRESISPAGQFATALILLFTAACRPGLPPSRGSGP